MRNVSAEFVKTMEERRDFYPYAKVTLSGGTVLTLDKTNFMMGGNSFFDGASMQGFPLGEVIAKTINLTFDNSQDQFSQHDFSGAIFQLYLEFKLSETTERLNLGKYTMITPETYGTTIGINAIDDAHKFDIEYDTGLSFPVAVGDLVRESCLRCGVPLGDTTFKNSDFVVRNKPEGITHRQLIAAAAQIACGNARIAENGYLRFNSYDFAMFEEIGGLDGGSFDTNTPHSSGDTADGGTFSPWSVGFVHDSGDFSMMRDIHVLHEFKEPLVIETDDVVITGISAKVDDEVYMAGDDGYVLTIDNPLVRGVEREVVDLIGQSLIGLKFRPFSGDTPSYPLAEYGDLAYVVDRKSNIYQTVITDVGFQFWGFTTLKCSADSPIRKSSSYSSQLTKAVVDARRNAAEQISAYDLAMQQLTSLITQSFGLFKTDEEQEDGSVIFYMHNKPLLKDSMTIWKMTADAFAVSTDGGKTWNAGMDSSGNAVMNVLSAIGINFDWARGGTLTLGGQNNTNGVLRMLDGDGVEIGKWDKDGIDILVERTDAGDQFFGRYITLGRGRAGSNAKAFDLGEHLGGSSISHFSVGWDGHVWARNATIQGSIQSSGEFGEVTVHGDGYVMGRHAPRGGGPVLSNPVGYISFNTFFIDNNDIPGTRVAGRGGIALFAPVLGVGAYTPVNQDGVYVTGQTGTIPIVASITDLGGGRIGWESMHLTFTKGLMTTIL